MGDDIATIMDGGSVRCGRCSILLSGSPFFRLRREFAGGARQRIGEGHHQLHAPAPWSSAAMSSRCRPAEVHGSFAGHHQRRADRESTGAVLQAGADCRARNNSAIKALIRGRIACSCSSSAWNWSRHRARAVNDVGARRRAIWSPFFEALRKLARCRPSSPAIQLIGIKLNTPIFLPSMLCRPSPHRRCDTSCSRICHLHRQ